MTKYPNILALYVSLGGRRVLVQVAGVNGLDAKLTDSFFNDLKDFIKKSIEQYCSNCPKTIQEYNIFSDEEISHVDDGFSQRIKELTKQSLDRGIYPPSFSPEKYYFGFYKDFALGEPEAPLGILGAEQSEPGAGADENRAPAPKTPASSARSAPDDNPKTEE